MTTYYDASRPLRTSPPADPVTMAGRAADRRLNDVLGKVRDLTAAYEAEEQTRGLEPELERLLDQIAGADGAPLAFRSLHRGVREGRITWQAVWSQPTLVAGGLDLLQAALRAQVAQARELRESTPRPGPRSTTWAAR